MADQGRKRPDASRRGARSPDHDDNGLQAFPQQRGDPIRPGGTGASPVRGSAHKVTYHRRGISSLPATGCKPSARIQAALRPCLGPRAGQGAPWPSKDWMQSQLAVRFGGEPRDYEGFFYVIFLLTHGAASLIAVAPKAQETRIAEENCIAICDLLLQNIHIFRQREQPAGA